MKTSLRLLAALLAVCCSSPAIAAAPQFTMNDVLSAPFVNNLSVSPDGLSFAYVADERGRHNIYFSAGGAPAKQITSYSDDDGQVLSALRIVPGNRGIVYVRGEGTNERGEYPNPLSLAEPPKQHVFLISTKGGTPVDLGEGHSPAVSPQGDRVVWLLHGQAYTSTIDTRATLTAAKASRLFDIRGALQELAYSPDGTRIAFTNGRGDHGFVVIYDMRTREITYASPAFTYDSSPAWSPDGKRIAFIREPGGLEDQDPYVEPDVAPWSIWVADAATGRAARVFGAAPGIGHFYYGTDSTQQLWWSRGGRIGFDWERDGWRHLYSVSSNGGTPRLLTPGAFEVETVVRSFDGTHLIYSSNQGDIDRRHIWTVSFDGGAPSQLTRGTDDQWDPAAFLRGTAFVGAGYARPPVVYLSESGAVRELGGGPAVPANYPAAEMVRPRLVTFKAPDGLTIHAQFFEANGGGKHCGLIFDHGGSRRQMLPGFHYMETYTNLYESNQFYANHGCDVLSINYRSGIMYGRNFRQAKNSGPKGASEYQDVLAGAAFLRHRPDVDPHRIGIYGLSYGGYLTALGLARNSNIFKAGVDMAGVHNWATIRDEDYGRPVGTDRERRIAFEASPEASLARWRSPVFMSQGDDDRNVPFAQGVDLATRLRARGVDVVQLVFPDETHENLTFAHMLQLYDASSAWLLRKLR